MTYEILIVATMVVVLACSIRLVGRLHERAWSRRRSWEIAGTPLPAPDDPRWERHGVNISLSGTAFSVEPRCSGHYSVVSFEGVSLGRWPRYARAVRESVGAREAEARAERALAAIMDDKPSNATLIRPYRR